MAAVQESALTAAGAREDVGEISQGRLMWRRFLQSKLAVGAGIVLIFLYLCAAFADFLSPNRPAEIDSEYANASPSQIFWDGGLAVCGSTQKLNEETFTWEYVSDCDNALEVQFFGRGYSYELFGLIETDRHLLTIDSDRAKLFLWGADTQGRDVFARSIHGARVSMTIGLVGVAISTTLAAVVGTASGYFRGVFDNLVQRLIEVLLSVPTLPLWALFAALLPRNITVVQRFFLISVVLSLVGWAGIARQVRGKVIAYSRADYVRAARSAGANDGRIIITHMIPNAMSHIVATAMLAIPAGIIAETSLSFLGIGMLPPAISWGVLLQDAQRIQVVTTYPWMLIPALLVIVAVTCYQLLGDGVRDAVDPYG